MVAGIGGGMIACFGAPSPRRQRRLLYVASSILIVNVINAVITEYTFYMAGQGLLLPISWTDFDDDDAEDSDDVLLNGSREQHVRSLVANARVTAGVAAAIILLAAFLDAQFSFCSIDSTQKSRHSKSSKSRGSHEQVSDIEYIIPRAKSNSEPKTTSSSVDAYAQSWVFETEVNNSSAPSPYLSATADVSDSSTTTQLDSTLKLTNGRINASVSPTLSARIIPIIIPQSQSVPVEKTSIIANPVVHIEEASDESTSNSNSDRKLCYMKSFSRTPSPVVLSAASSQMSLNYNHNPPIYECLEKLTDPQVYRSRLNSALSSKDEPHYASTARKSELPSPRQTEPVHYASLMVELQEAITSKKNNNITSPGQTISVSESSKSESSQKTDAEFSKELEAALQLIQDLESPNTAETPSEPGRSVEGQRPLAVWRHSDASGSEKTLSAVGSLGELTSPLTETLPVLPAHQNVPMTVTVHGKDSSVAPRRLIQCSSSQSTSGYSSPTRKLTPNNWSTASSIDERHTSTTDLGRTLSFQIRNTNNSAVISLFPNPQHKNASLNSRNSFCSGAKSVTVVKINSDHDNNNLDLLQLNSNTLDIENNNALFPYDDKNHDSYENSLTRSHKANVRRSTSMTAAWNMMSLLRKKKHVPKLSPELESAIIKSESLAHLTDTELLARLEKNKQIQRVRCGYYNFW